MVIKRILTCVIFIAVNAFFIHASQASSMTIPMYLTTKTGHGAPVGKITLIDIEYGLLLIPELQYLPTGVHGFHVHVYPNCDEKGKAAGGHLDPNDTKKHLGPYNNRVI